MLFVTFTRNKKVYIKIYPTFTCTLRSFGLSQPDNFCQRKLTKLKRMHLQQDSNVLTGIANSTEYFHQPLLQIIGLVQHLTYFPSTSNYRQSQFSILQRTLNAVNLSYFSSSGLLGLLRPEITYILTVNNSFQFFIAHNVTSKNSSTFPIVLNIFFPTKLSIHLQRNFFFL